jgi:hypothetical protein
MECGLSSAPTTQDRDRPTDLRRHYHTRKDTQRQPQLTGFKQFSYRFSHAGSTDGSKHFNLFVGQNVSFKLPLRMSKMRAALHKLLFVTSIKPVNSWKTIS